jgi:sortase A
MVARAFVVAGLVLLIAFTGDIAFGLWQQQQLNRAFQHQVGSTPPPAAVTGAALVQPHPVDGVDFAIRVPKLNYFAAVAEGTDSNTLAGGPGHYPATAWPGQNGDVGVAAHNVYWIQFNDLKAGDEVKLETRWGTYTYRISGKRIVWPDDRTVLVPSSTPKLTLTTCWPLWAGQFASQRLVFFADQIDPATAVN